MNKLLTITAAALLALSTGVSFAEGKGDSGERSERGEHFCHRWQEYLERYGETAYFEKNIEKKYSRLCRRHEEEGERGEHREHGDRERGEHEGDKS